MPSTRKTNPFVRAWRGIVASVSRWKTLTVSFRIPPIIDLGGTWAPVSSERDLAWHVYVELATRITLRQMDAQGSLREALNSIYSTLAYCRQALHDAGPDCAPHRDNGSSAGQIVGMVANGLLAPLLSSWHNRLKQYESDRPTDGSVDVVTWERRWELSADLAVEIEILQEDLRELAENLRRIAGVGSLLAAAEEHQLAVPGTGTTSLPLRNAPVVILDPSGHLSQTS